jgi:hypothetical protein
MWMLGSADRQRARVGVSATTLAARRVRRAPGAQLPVCGGRGALRGYLLWLGCGIELSSQRKRQHDCTHASTEQRALQSAAASLCQQQKGPGPSCSYYEYIVTIVT